MGKLLLEISYLSEGVRRVTLSRRAAEKRLGPEAAKAFHSFVRDLEAASTFEELPVQPLTAESNDSLQLSYDLAGEITIDVQPMMRQMVADQWPRAHRVKLLRLRVGVEVIV